MKQLKKTLLTLVALLAVTTGAWATTVTWVENDFYGTGSAAFTKYDVTVTPSNNDARLSNFFYKNGVNTFTTTLGNFTKIEIVFMPESSPLTVSGWDYELIEAVQPDPDEMPDVWEYTSKLTWTGDAESVSIQGAVDFIKSITFTIAEPASGPEVAWNAASKTGKFTMPAGNVTLEPEYYPQATLAFQGLTAAEDAAAKTEAPLAVVADGAVTGGTLMYYVATDKNFSQADAIALAETQWSAAIPTAETVDAAGTCYVWYYIKGDDEHSDTDPVPLAVTVLPEPTYAVTFAEGTDPNEWTASPNAGVTKGTEVKVTYTGSKKVIGVKAEKKAALPATITVTWNNDDITGNSNSFTKDGVTITAGIIDFSYKDFIGGGTFTTTLGNFTKIEVTTGYWCASGTGWSASASMQSATWTGTPASSVSFSDEIVGMGMGTTKFVFTIEPTN